MVPVMKQETELAMLPVLDLLLVPASVFPAPASYGR